MTDRAAGRWPDVARAHPASWTIAQRAALCLSAPAGAVGAVGDPAASPVVSSCTPRAVAS